MTTTPSLSLTVDTKGEAPIDVEQFDGHTPGPWRTESPPCNIREWAETYTYAKSVRGPQRDGTSTAVADVLSAANARLIAAAPTLLAELKSARERIVELTGKVEGLTYVASQWKNTGEDLRDREAIECDSCDRYFPREQMHFGTVEGDIAPVCAHCEDCQSGKVTPKERERTAAAEDASLRGYIASLEERNEALKDDLDRAQGVIRDVYAQLEALNEIEAQP